MESCRNGRFCGKSLLVFGGASGLGKKVAEDFIKEGGKAALADISEAKLDQCRQEFGENCITFLADATKEAEVERVVADTAAAFGRIDAAVNSVLKAGYCEIVDLPADVWRRELDVTLTGVFLTLKHEGRQMLRQGGGSIINIASLRSKLPSVGGATYCTSKCAMDMLTRVAALEMSPKQVRVNCVSPGLTLTPATQPVFDNPKLLDAYLDSIPMGRGGVAEDISAAVLFLASDEASWITGENLSVDGGWHMTRYPDIKKLF